MRRINLAQLSPLRRGLVLGFLRARRQSRKEMRALAQSFDDELVALQHEFDEIAVEYHHMRVEAAIDEAFIERGANPDMPLH